MKISRIARIIVTALRITLFTVMFIILCIYAFFSSLDPAAGYQTIWQLPCLFLSLALILGLAIGYVLTRRIFFALQWPILGLLIYALFFRDKVDWPIWMERTQADRTRYSIAGPTVDEKMFDVKASPAKLVLVDFWATWCIPCKAQVRYIKDAYAHYHNQGLEVAGVSSDFDKDALSYFIKANGMVWPQIFFDEQTAENPGSPLAEQCGIKAIPKVLLIDPLTQLSVTPVRSGAQLESVIPATLKIMSGKDFSSAQLEKQILIFIPIKPYIFSLVAALIGAAVARGKSRTILKLIREKESRQSA